MTTTTDKNTPYQWVILTVLFFVLFVSNGMTFGGMAVFDLELLKALSAEAGREVSITELKLKDTIMFATASVFGLAGGWLIDKVGVKPLIIAGLALFAVGNYLFGQVQTLQSVYWLQFSFGIMLVLAGLMVNVYGVSSWFSTNRGLALGLLLAGTSLGNTVFPQLNTWLISENGWREAFTYLALVPLALIPIVLLLLKKPPTNTTAKDSETQVLSGYTLIEALKSRNFWVLATIAMCTFYCILGMGSNVFIYLSMADYSPELAATGVSSLFVGGLIGKIIAGYLAEKFGHKLVLIIAISFMFIGSVLLVIAISQSSETAVWLGIAFFGFGWGGIYTLIQLLTADIFGLLALGKILSCINILDAFGGALGPIVTGSLYDKTGSYLASFSIFSILLLISLCAAAMLNMQDAADVPQQD